MQRFHLLIIVFAASLATVSCSAPFSCAESEFECPATESCIPAKWKCDGENDCSDGKDESDCGEVTCKSGFYKCRNGRCIESTWICDGHADCPDGDDEAPTQKCNRTTCKPSDFQCTNGDCIQGSFKCDNDDDCDDESDEEGCPVAGIVCQANEFKCDNNMTCISTSMKCNGKSDCVDGSDEKGCSSSCDNEKFFLCKNHECIPKVWRCDGTGECVDNTDEEGCPSPTPPPPCTDDKFRCGDGECIPNSWKCDLYPDCSDGHDEVGCSTRVACTSQEFKCHKSGKCIPKNSRCDRITDCSDGSDEAGCSRPVTPSCDEASYRCGTSSLCVTMDKVCNKIKDCPSGEDESTKCGVDECKNFNGHCYHTCNDLPIGYNCSCHIGFKLLNDSMACEDIDECKETYGACSQSCVNTKGSYKCSCVDGYVDDIGLKTCKATGLSPYLIFGEQHSIRKLSMSATQYDIISSNRKAPMAVDYDVDAGYIYWTDILDEKIERTLLSGNGSVETVVNGVKHSNGLAVDWIGKKLYWTDESVNSIEVSELNGDKRLVLFTVSVDDPRGIAVDPFERYIFWTDWGSVHPKIERASMDGDSVSRRVILDTDIMWPTALTLDTILQRVYFADTKMQRIETCKYDGTARVKILASGVLHALGLSIFEDNLYYTDYSLDSVFHINKLTGHSFGKLKEKLERPVGIKVVHRALQRKVETRCSKNNGGCSYLCLLSTNALKYSCRCPVGMLLRGDGKSCMKIGKPDLPILNKDKTTQSSVKRGCVEMNGGCSHTCFATSDGNNTCSCPEKMTLGIDQKTCRKNAKPTEGEDGDKRSSPSSGLGTNVPVARKSKASLSNNGPMIAGVTVATFVALFVVVGIILFWRRRVTTSGRSILFYKDVSRTPLQNDFDDDQFKSEEEVGSRSRVQFA